MRYCVDTGSTQCFFLEDRGTSCDTFLKTWGGGSCTEIMETYGAHGRLLSCLHIQAYFRCLGSRVCPLDPGCGGTGRAEGCEVTFCVGGSCEELMWCPCTGAACAGWVMCKLFRVMETGCAGGTVILLWTFGFVKVVWIVVVVSDQNQKQLGRVADGMILPFLKFPLAFVHQCSSFSIKKSSKNSYVNLLIPRLAGLRVKAACRALKPGKFLIYTGMKKSRTHFHYLFGCQESLPFLPWKFCC